MELTSHFQLSSKSSGLAPPTRPSYHTINRSSPLFDAIHGRRVDTTAQMTISTRTFTLGKFVTLSFSPPCLFVPFPFRSSAPVIGSPGSQQRVSTKAKLACDYEKRVWLPPRASFLLSPGDLWLRPLPTSCGYSIFRRFNRLWETDINVRYAEQ